jgi:membrane protein implicated in regulation of membrane protease activity
MAASPSGPERHGTTGVLAVGAAAFAVFCCAGLPLVASLVGGLTLAGVLGVSAGVLIAAAAVATAVVALRVRRRRAGPSSHPPRSAKP